MEMELPIFAALPADDDAEVMLRQIDAMTYEKMLRLVRNASLRDPLYEIKEAFDEIGAVLATAADTLGDAINPPPPKRHFDNP